MGTLGGESTKRGGELEGPEEVVGGLEVGSDGVDLVDEIFNADDSLGSEDLLDDGVIGNGDTLSFDLSVSTLVDELLHGLERRGTIGDVRLDETEHVEGGLVELDEDTVVDLTETEKLEDLLGLGGHTVDTADTDDESNLILIGHVVVAGVLGLAAKTDDAGLDITVLLDVLLGTLVDILALGDSVLFLLNRTSLTLSLDLFKGLSLLEEGLGNGGRTVGRNKK